MLGLNGALLGHVATATAIDLRRGNVDILFDERELPDFFVQPHIGHHVGLIPMLGMKPAFGDHALRGKIHHIVRLEIFDGGNDPIQITIQVKLLEAEVGGLCTVPIPFVR